MARSVLNPNNTDATPDEAATTASRQFSPASSASQLPYTGSAPAVTGLPNGGGSGPSDAEVGILAIGETGGGGGATVTPAGGGTSTTTGARSPTTGGGSPTPTSGSPTTQGSASPTTTGGGSPTTSRASPTPTEQGAAGKHGSSFGAAEFLVGMVAWVIYLV